MGWGKGGGKKKKTKRWDGIGWVLPGGRRVTCCFPGICYPDTALPGCLRSPGGLRLPRLSVRQHLSFLFSLLSPVSGWCQGPVFWFRRFFYLASLLLFSLLLYRYTVEKGPRERLGDALWRYLWRCPMAMPIGNSLWPNGPSN